MHRLRLACAALAVCAACALHAAEPAPFAVVGDTVISAAEYKRALSVAMRKKYYHAKPPEAEIARFQREVGDDIVNRVLLLAEARRRGIQPDRERIAATIAGYDRQYQGSDRWASSREKMLAAVTPQLESESLLERLEALVRRGPEPAEAVLQAYYEQHRPLFVEPEQVKLSVIVLRVDPSARKVAWTGALEEAKNIHRRLQNGADFGDLARLHSGDRSAAQGGQMEYMHRGMLPEPVQAVIDKVPLQGLSEPVQLLEGYVILRLDARRPAQQRAFEQVRQRAAELWQREQSEARWKGLIAELRRATPVKIDESHYAPLPSPGEPTPRAG